MANFLDAPPVVVREYSVLSVKAYKFADKEREGRLVLGGKILALGGAINSEDGLSGGREVLTIPLKGESGHMLALQILKTVRLPAQLSFECEEVSAPGGKSSTLVPVRLIPPAPPANPPAK